MTRWIIVLLIALPASATDFFFAATSAGSNNGSSCANAYAYSDGTNGWNTAGKQTAGNNLHVCGTFTGGSNQGPFLTFTHSGSSGNPITVTFESGAILQASYFQTSAGGGLGGGITLGNGNSWILINGVCTATNSQGKCTATQGTIRNTANGSSLANQQASTLISGFGCSNCIIENLSLLNVYVNVSGNGVLGDNSVARAIDPSGPNWSIHDNLISNCGWCVFSSYANNDTNENWYNNTFTEFGHAFAFAAGSGVACIAPCLFLHDNDMGANTSWDAPGCPFHKDGLHLFGNGSTSTMDGIYIYNNYWHGDWGTCPTGFLFSESGGSDPGVKSYWVWNNVGVVVNTSFVNTNGWMNMSSGHSGTQNWYSNTMIGNGQNDNSLCYTAQHNVALTFEDNTASGCGDPVSMISDTLTTADYNFYGANVCQNGGNCFIWNGSFTGSFSAWKALCSCDSHAVSNLTPLLNSDGSPQSGSPIIEEGANLGSISTSNLLTLANDTTKGLSRTSLNRPATATCSTQGTASCWDVGAYQFSGSSQVATPTFSPTAGTYSTSQSVTISSTTGGATLCYTTDGSTPTANGGGTCTHGTTYSTPVLVLTSETLKAIGSKVAFTDSSVASAAYSLPITLVQNIITPLAGTCSSSANTCTIVVAATGASHAGILVAENATGSSVTITSVSGAGTWTIPSACHAFSASVGSINCAYTLNTTGGATSITVTWSTSTPGFSRISFYEYLSTTSSPIVIDTGTTPINSASNATTTTPSGASLTLAGTNDAIIQGVATSGAVVNSVASPYNGFLASATQFGSSNNVNTASNAAPTWTLSATSATLVNGIALTEQAQFTLTVTVSGLGTVTDNLSEISCPSSCSGSYTTGTVVTLTAVPSAGNTFTGWSGTGGCTGTGTCSLTMNAAKAATATFTNLPNATVMYPGTSLNNGAMR